MAYTDADTVREQAGFQGNTDITDDYIDQLIKQSDAQINSCIYGIYGKPSTSDLTDTPAGDLLEELSVKLSVGNLFLNEFKEGTETYQKGIDQVNYVLGRLNKFKKGYLKLYDGDGNELSRNGDVGTIKSNPTNQGNSLFDYNQLY